MSPFSSSAVHISSADSEGGQPGPDLRVGHDVAFQAAVAAGVHPPGDREHLGVVHRQPDRPQAAHRVAQDRAALPRRDRPVSGVDVGDQVPGDEVRPVPETGEFA